MATKPKSATERSDHENKPKQQMGLVELFKTEPRFRVEVAAVVVGILVLVVYFFQLRVMDETEKIDQRAWVSVRVPDVYVKPGEPVSAELQIGNTGKTPARQVHGNAVIKEVPVDGDVGELSYPNGNYLGLGSIFPNETHKIAVYLPDPSGKTQPMVGTPDLLNDAKNKRIYFIIYGRLSYEDALGKNHWLTFCSLSQGIIFNTLPTSCLAYNDYDH